MGIGAGGGGRIKMTLEEIRRKYKRGWYRKGKTYRFLCAIDGMGFLIYKTKTAMKKKTSTVWGINPECDEWFSEAEYIGLDLEEKE